MSNKAIIEYKGIFYESDIYICSEDGRIFNSNTGREIVGSPDKDGYLLVSLQLHTETTRVEVQRRKHRVIATTLLGIPTKEKNIVNHKDGNKQNNQIDNLEWCTVRENTLHASRTGLLDGLIRTAVYCYNLKGDYVGHYDSIRQAAEELKINRHGISRVLAGTQIQSENYFFSYDTIEDKSFFNKFDNNKFILLDHNLNIFGEFSSFREMEKVVPVSRGTLKRYYDLNKDKEKDFVFPTRSVQRFIALDKGKI